MCILYLGYTRGDDANTNFRDEFHGYPRVWIGAFQIVNQLGQILDGVDIVVRRRRDQTHSRHGMPGSGDISGDLVPYTKNKRRS